MRAPIVRQRSYVSSTSARVDVERDVLDADVVVAMLAAVGGTQPR
jgi:hypothetical protein